MMSQQTKFSIGDNVQIIDYEEHPSEWAKFVITDIQSSRYCLVAKDQHETCDPLWVTSYEICPVTLNSEQ